MGNYLLILSVALVASGCASSGSNTPNVSPIVNTEGNTNNDNSSQITTASNIKASSYFAGQTGSYTYKYLTDETERAKLISAINEKSNMTSSCNNNSSSICYKTTEAGTLLGVYKQSYSSYAVIREGYDADHNTPSNSYIYIVGTPLADKSLALNATYKGQAAYTRKNFPNIVTQADFELTVSDTQVSGRINKANGDTAVTFNQGDITVENNTVGFNGTATFHKGSFSNSADADFSGTYQGAFAGANAEEVVGIFESDNYYTNDTTYTQSVQGAFAGVKQ